MRMLFVMLSIGFILGCLIGYVGNDYLRPKQTSKVLKVIDKSDYTGLYNAYKTPIQISTETKGNKKIITASDGYKETIFAERNTLNSISGNIGLLYFNVPTYYAEITYMRRLKDFPVSVGGSLLVMPKGVGLSAGLSYSF